MNGPSQSSTVSDSDVSETDDGLTWEELNDAIRNSESRLDQPLPELSPDESFSPHSGSSSVDGNPRRDAGERSRVSRKVTISRYGGSLVRQDVDVPFSGSRTRGPVSTINSFRLSVTFVVLLVHCSDLLVNSPTHDPLLRNNNNNRTGM